MKWLLALGFILALGTACQAQETRIAAVVNDNIITADDLENRLMLVMKSSGIPDPPQNRQQLTPRILQQCGKAGTQSQGAVLDQMSVVRGLGGVQSGDGYCRLGAQGVDPLRVDEVAKSLFAAGDIEQSTVKFLIPVPR